MDDRYLIEVNVQYPQELRELHNDLSFLPERMEVIAGVVGGPHYW